MLKKAAVLTMQVVSSAAFFNLSYKIHTHIRQHGESDILPILAFLPFADKLLQYHGFH